MMAAVQGHYDDDTLLLEGLCRMFSAHFSVRNLGAFSSIFQPVLVARMQDKYFRLTSGLFTTDHSC